MKAPNVNNRKAEDVEQACDCGRYALESELEGINYFVDGKPYYTGKEN